MYVYVIGITVVKLYILTKVLLDLLVFSVATVFIGSPSFSSSCFQEMGLLQGHYFKTLSKCCFNLCNFDMLAGSSQSRSHIYYLYNLISLQSNPPPPVSL